MRVSKLSYLLSPQQINIHTKKVSAANLRRHWSIVIIVTYPLGQFHQTNTLVTFFFFESQPFFCNGNDFLCTCSAYANMEGDSANLSRHCGVVAVVPDSLGQFQARNLPVIMFFGKNPSLTCNGNVYVSFLFTR